MPAEWIEALHIISVVCWFAALFYLPRLFVYHAMAEDQISIERCAACGTRMWHLPDVAPDLVILCAGTLDDPSWAIPTSHIFIEQAAPDAVAAEDAIAVEQFQTTRAALWERFSEIYLAGR